LSCCRLRHERAPSACARRSRRAGIPGEPERRIWILDTARHTVDEKPNPCDANVVARIGGDVDDVGDLSVGGWRVIATAGGSVSGGPLLVIGVVMSVWI
jgi:hypothetical protein